MIRMSCFEEKKVEKGHRKAAAIQAEEALVVE